MVCEYRVWFIKYGMGISSSNEFWTVGAQSNCCIFLCIRLFLLSRGWWSWNRKLLFIVILIHFDPVTLRQIANDNLCLLGIKCVCCIRFANQFIYPNALECIKCPFMVFSVSFMHCGFLCLFNRIFPEAFGFCSSPYECTLKSCSFQVGFFNLVTIRIGIESLLAKWLQHFFQFFFFVVNFVSQFFFRYLHRLNYA